MKNIIKDFVKNPHLKRYDMGVFLFMSHGNQTGSEESVLKGSDGLEIETSWIAAQLNNCNCTGLLHKPKVLIYQICR